MKHLFLLLFMLCVVVGRSQSGPVEHVIIIGVDGMSVDGVKRAHTPNMDSLMAQGSYSFECQAVKPTVSSPNWASITDGAPPKDHGIWSNRWQRSQIKDSVYCNGKKGQVFPTIFRVLREQKKHAQIVCFAGWWSFVRLVEDRVCNIRQRTLTMWLCASRSAIAIKARKPDLLFVHLNDVDETGHKYGHGTPKYYEAVELADKCIGTIVAAVNKAGIADKTMILIIADHGGINKGHGGNTPQEVNVPLIIKGPGIKKGYQLRSIPLNYDATATVAKVLSIHPPACWEGKPIEEIFEK